MVRNYSLKRFSKKLRKSKEYKKASKLNRKYRTKLSTEERKLADKKADSAWRLQHK